MMAKKSLDEEQRVSDLRLLASHLVGCQVNLILKMVRLFEVLLAPFQEKQSIRYSLTSSGKLC